MQWSKEIQPYLEQVLPIQVTQGIVTQVWSLVDLTSLNANDTQASIAKFCEKARSPFGHVAAVCVSPQFIRLVADEFSETPIKAATVANFPTGDASLESVLLEIGNALANGAQEIDVVFPYKKYLSGDKSYGHEFVTACRAACGKNVLLKVILETGALQDLNIIAAASYDALYAGADFIKTSTGKTDVGASLEAAAVMLIVAKALGDQEKRTIGVKVSGGIRDFAQAALYVELAEKILGRAAITPETFRIGSSALADEIAKY